MGVRARLVCLGIGAAIGLSAGTQFAAAHYDYHRALGWGLAIGDGVKLYPPWDILVWSKKWSASPSHGPVLRAGAALIMLGVALGGMLVRLFDQGNGALGQTNDASGVTVNYGHRARGWGDPKALIKAGLSGLEGVVLGRINRPSVRDFFLAPKLLTSPDMRPALVTGGTRSGKGRGIVVPTLLTWNWSTIVFDPKGELWARRRQAFAASWDRRSSSIRCIRQPHGSTLWPRLAPVTGPSPTCKSSSRSLPNRAVRLAIRISGTNRAQRCFAR